MKMNALSRSLACVTACAILFAACGGGSSSSDDDGQKTGSIAGKALYSNATDHSGIVVFAESVAGNQTSSVRAAASGTAPARAADIAAETTTTADGTYTLDGLVPGTYAVYAVSNDTSEGAVCLSSVTVTALEVSDVEDLVLTATGKVSGKVNWNGQSKGNGGITVYIAGTSYMAFTAEDGTFVITGVPAAEGYQLFLVAEKKTYSWKTLSVVAKQDNPAGTYDNTNGYPSVTPHVTAETDPNGIKFTVRFPDDTWLNLYDAVTRTRYVYDHAAAGTYTFVYPLVKPGEKRTFDCHFGRNSVTGEDFHEYVGCVAGGGLGTFFDCTASSWTDIDLKYTESGSKRILKMTNWPSSLATLPSFVVGPSSAVEAYGVRVEAGLGKSDWTDSKFVFGYNIDLSDPDVNTQFRNTGVDVLNLDVEYGACYMTAAQINAKLANQKAFFDGFFIVKLVGYEGYFWTDRVTTGDLFFNVASLTP